ncbi:MAG: bacillithiol biosynthesis BshC, partial [Bacteroidota bacterium]
MNLLEKENINLSSSVREYVKKENGVEFKMSNHFDQGHRKVLAEAIRKQYAGLELHHEVKNNIDNLEKSNSVTIVTGHQLCLAGGPLFLFYKICSTIALSKKWSDSLKGYNVVPVFWLASEDHDLNEIRRFWFKENWVELGPEVSGIAGDFPTDFFSQWLNTEIERHSEFTSLLQIAYSKFETNAESFRFWINEIFGENGVVCIDGNEESLKQLALPLFQKELEEQFVNAGVEIQNEKLRTENQTPAIQPRKLNLFHINQGQRFRLEIEGENIVEVNSNEVLSKAELLAEVKGLSPNVLLRPVYQEFLLPNLAYVGGSGELEYWIQLPEVF